MATVAPRKKSLANRGKVGEDIVQKYLTAWMAANTKREFARLVDTKSAGRIIKAADADFAYWCVSEGVAYHGLIEVKETEHGYRLGRDRLTQLPRMRKREKCGGRSFVLVLHTTLGKQGKWRAMGVPYLTDTGDKGSWNLSNLPLCDSAQEALATMDDVVFPPVDLDA
jgi:hypothetical protein